MRSFVVLAAQLCIAFFAVQGPLAGQLARWRRGLAGFASASLPGEAVVVNNGSWRRSGRLLRVRAPETRRLAALIEGYDAACAATVTVTAACRRSGSANPHGASIGDRRRRLRALMALGYGGVRLRAGQSGTSPDSAQEASRGGPADTPRTERRPR